MNFTNPKIGIDIEIIEVKNFKIFKSISFLLATKLFVHWVPFIANCKMWRHKNVMKTEAFDFCISHFLLICICREPLF